MKKYLDAAAVSHLANMKIRARLVVEGFSAGMHRSPLKGHSTDFADYRRYTKGDDPRHIDWKVYAKSERYYIKEFEDQASLSAYILLDASGSMAYGSTSVRKFDYAAYLAGALLYLTMAQQDNAGLFVLGAPDSPSFPPRRGPAHLDRSLECLEKISPVGEGGVLESLEDFTLRLRRRGLIVLLSDLMDEPEPIVEVLKQLRSKKNEVIVFHILDPDEIDFPFNQLMEFEDFETGERLRLDCESVRKSYREAFERYRRHFENELPRVGVDYCFVRTSETFHEVLSRYLLRRNRARD